jgi:protein-L-isoaspartate(D-aspartate) O-methyltransferase
MNFEETRRNMVNSQLLPNKVTDSSVLEAFSNLPRELFVPSNKKNIAYIDSFISISPGRFLMEPMITARMLQALELKPFDVVLSIGCGTGYSVAILSKIVETVFAVEEDADLISDATKIFLENEIDNVVMIEGSLKEGCEDHAPYDAIFFDGGIDQISENIENQLGDKGRASALVMNSHMLGSIKVYKKYHDFVSCLDLCEAMTPFLPGFEAKSEFTF